MENQIIIIAVACIGLGIAFNKLSQYREIKMLEKKAKTTLPLDDVIEYLVSTGKYSRIECLTATRNLRNQYPVFLIDDKNRDVMFTHKGIVILGLDLLLFGIHKNVPITIEKRAS